MTDCPFCAPNWPNLTILKRVDCSPDGLDYAVIRPLDPVTDGHVLVICATHTQDAAQDALVAAGAMDVAATWVRDNAIEANIITSIGRNATQTVMHTHVHVVPRRPNDGLPLPWTPQQFKAAQEAYKRKPSICDEHGGGPCK